MNKKNGIVKDRVLAAAIVRNMLKESFAMGSYDYGEDDIYGKWEHIDRDLRSLGWVRQKSKSSIGEDCMLTEPVWTNPKLTIGENPTGRNHPIIGTKMLKNLRGASWTSFLILDASGTDSWSSSISYKGKEIASPKEEKVTVQGHPTLEKSLEALLNANFHDELTRQTYKVRYWFEKWAKMTGDVERPRVPRSNAGLDIGRREVSAGTRGGSFGLGSRIASFFR